MNQENFSTEWFLNKYEERKEKILADFKTFLRFESISALKDYKSEVLACLEWLTKYFQDMGFHTEHWPTPGYPTLYAEWMGAGPDAPTVLIYNHYDVQPVDPVSAWTSPPFEANIRDGKIFARGAQDNKGQCWYAVTAVEALLRESGKLPVNVKFLIEGEEEIGSPGISKILPEYKAKVRADHLLVLDCCIPRADVPAVTLGLRGFVGLDIEITAAKFDLHSGAHGGLAVNPNHVLVNLISRLWDKDGHVVVPGYYDGVKGLSPEESARLYTEFDAADYQREFGASPTGGEKGISPNERRWVRPALEVNAMWGGHIGEGIKTIIPAKAHARISSRLVPGQAPEPIAEKITAYLQSLCPPGVDMKITPWPGRGMPVRASADSAVVKAAAKAYEEACDAECKFVLEGWSVPVVAGLVEHSGGEAALCGFGLSTDAIHAPDEHFDLNRLKQGFVMIGRTLQHLSV